MLREVTVGSESDRSVEEVKEHVRYAARPMQDYRQSMQHYGEVAGYHESASDLHANDQKETGDFGMGAECSLPY